MDVNDFSGRGGFDGRITLSRTDIDKLVSGDRLTHECGPSRLYVHYTNRTDDELELVHENCLRLLNKQ